MFELDIYLQVYYTKVLNECKFPHTGNGDKVKEKGLNTCNII